MFITFAAIFFNFLLKMAKGVGVCRILWLLLLILGIINNCKCFRCNYVIDVGGYGELGESV